MRCINNVLAVNKTIGVTRKPSGQGKVIIKSHFDRVEGHSKLVRTYDGVDKNLKSAMNNDFSDALRDVIHRGKSDIIPQILKSQRSFMETKQKSRTWMTPLKVLALRGTMSELKEASPANAAAGSDSGQYFEHDYISTTRYLALSYVWKNSAHEGKVQHSWQVRGRGCDEGSTCRVRDSVLDRVVRYMQSRGVYHLWVDKECIDSENTRERQQALQCMDLVYCASEEPLAVLSVPIRTRIELAMLQSLLNDQLVAMVDDRGTLMSLQIKDHHEEEQIYRVLDLLHRMTSDDWWSRAWCFQEEYRATKDMKLLIPHYLGTDVPDDTEIFGDLTGSGELTISSSTFRQQTTRFILAYVTTAKTHGKMYDRGTCLQILGRAGDYALLSQYGHILDLEAKGKSTSTLVLNDLQHKNYTVPSDMLNIAANCNVYYRTMNTGLIDNYKASMSIAMLTMWFLNGEIFWNDGNADPGRGNRAWIEDQNVFTHLDSIAFDACPEIGEQSRLAYRRKLRFLRPKLMSKGVETYGHLFHLTQVIKLDAESVSTSDPAQAFLNVASELKNVDSKFAARLEKFVAEEFNQGHADFAWASRHAMSLSATNLITRLRERPYLAFGILANRDDGSTSGEVDAGIFAVNSLALSPDSSFVFNSWQQGSRGAPWYKNQPEEDKYVSLKVSIVEDSLNSASPLLCTEAWVDGLCFYEGATQHPYTFPWPKHFYSRLGRS